MTLEQLDPAVSACGAFACSSHAWPVGGISVRSACNSHVHLNYETDSALSKACHLYLIPSLDRATGVDHAVASHSLLLLIGNVLHLPRYRDGRLSETNPR
jgi:hypothetical protein